MYFYQWGNLSVFFIYLSTKINKEIQTNIVSGAFFPKTLYLNVSVFAVDEFFLPSSNKLLMYEIEMIRNSYYT